MPKGNLENYMSKLSKCACCREMLRQITKDVDCRDNLMDDLVKEIGCWSKGDMGKVCLLKAEIMSKRDIGINFDLSSFCALILSFGIFFESFIKNIEQEGGVLQTAYVSILIYDFLCLLAIIFVILKGFKIYKISSDYYYMLAAIEEWTRQKETIQQDKND